MNKDISLLADKLIAQEVAFGLLLHAVQQMYPEISAKLIDGLDHVLKTSPIPTSGARANLVALRNGIAKSQPTPSIGH